MRNAIRPSCLAAAALLAALVVAFIAISPGYAAPTCTGSQCSCKGDDECNDMFKNYCTESGGSCNNDNDSCTCAQKQSPPANPTATKGAPPKTKTGISVTKPVEKAK